MHAGTNDLAPRFVKLMRENRALKAELAELKAELALAQNSKGA